MRMNKTSYMGLNTSIEIHFISFNLLVAEFVYTPYICMDIKLFLSIELITYLIPLNFYFVPPYGIS